MSLSSLTLVIRFLDRDLVLNTFQILCQPVPSAVLSETESETESESEPEPTIRNNQVSALLSVVCSSLRTQQPIAPPTAFLVSQPQRNAFSNPSEVIDRDIVSVSHLIIFTAWTQMSFIKSTESDEDELLINEVPPTRGIKCKFEGAVNTLDTKTRRKPH